MRYAYFPGCKIAHHLPLYGASTEAVCASLGIELVPLEFNCCGQPAREESLLAWLFSAARNLALASRAGLPILTPCKCCFGSLKQAAARLERDAALADEVGHLLSREGLEPGRAETYHLLTVLDRELKSGVLGRKVVKPLTGLKVACHYGCHALRPAVITGFDDPLAPVVFERVVRALGARTMAWELRLECCGQPLRGRDEATSQALMRQKLASAQAAGAEVLATACTHCQLQFADGQAGLSPDDPLREAPAAVTVSQLAATALGLESDQVLTGKYGGDWFKSPPQSEGG